MNSSLIAINKQSDYHSHFMLT